MFLFPTKNNIWVFFVALLYVCAFIMEGQCVPGRKTCSFVVGDGEAMRQPPILRAVLIVFGGRLVDKLSKTAAAIFFYFYNEQLLRVLFLKDVCKLHWKQVCGLCIN